MAARHALASCLRMTLHLPGLFKNTHSTSWLRFGGIPRYQKPWGTLQTFSKDLHNPVASSGREFTYRPWFMAAVTGTRLGFRLHYFWSCDNVRVETARNSWQRRTAKNRRRSCFFLVSRPQVASVAPTGCHGRSRSVISPSGGRADVEIPHGEPNELKQLNKSGNVLLQQLRYTESFYFALSVFDRTVHERQKQTKTNMCVFDYGPQ
jgi:hypothetical protein